MNGFAAKTLECVSWTGAALLLGQGLLGGGLQHGLPWLAPSDASPVELTAPVASTNAEAGAVVAGAGTAAAASPAASTARIGIEAPRAGTSGAALPDLSSWSVARAAAFLQALGGDPGPAAGRLTIHRLGIDAPLYRGTGTDALDRGLGLIEGTAAPGSDGHTNTGIAGHRDGWFRQLGSIEAGDTIDLRTPQGLFRYEVYGTQVVAPDAVHVLERGDDTRLTLVTCYPFHFLGPAPRRFIVQARLAATPD